MPGADFADSYDRRNDLRSPVAVAITAAASGERLGAIFQALAAEHDGAGEPLPVFAAVGDRLSAAAGAFEAVRGQTGLKLCLFARQSGARRGADGQAAIEAAVRHLESQKGAGDPVLLVNDANAVPAPGWRAALLRAVSDGADLAAAAPALRPGAGPTADGVLMASIRYRQLCVRLEELLDPVAWDPPPRHGDDSGASFAMRLSALRAAGGLPEGPVDRCRLLLARVRQAGGIVRHPIDARIWVPPHVLAGLGTIAPAVPEMPVMMPGPDHLEAVFRHRHRLRMQLQERHAALPPEERGQAVRAALALMTPQQIVAPDPLPVAEAIRKLQRRLNELRPRLPAASAPAIPVGWSSGLVERSI